MAIWRQRGSGSEVLAVVLCLIMLGEQWCRHRSEKSLKNKCFWCFFLRAQISRKKHAHSTFHMIQIHEKEANGALSEVLPDRNCFGRAEFLTNDSACINAFLACIIPRLHAVLAMLVILGILAPVPFLLNTLLFCLRVPSGWCASMLGVVRLLLWIDKVGTRCLQLLLRGSGVARRWWWKPLRGRSLIIALLVWWCIAEKVVFSLAKVLVYLILYILLTFQLLNKL